MPKIQRYDSDAQLTRMAPAEKTNPEQWGTTGRMLQEGADRFAEINQKFAKLDNAKRYMEQQSKLQEELTAVQTEAENDPDLFRNRAKYFKRMDEIQKKNSGDFYDAETALDFQMKSKTLFDGARISIDSKARKTLIDNTLANNIRMEEGLKMRAKMLPRDKQGMIERQKLYMTAAENDERLRRIGALTDKDVAERELKRPEEWGKDQFYHDLQTGRPASEIAQDLENGAYGIKDPQTLVSLTKLNESNAKRIEAEQAKAIKEQQDANMFRLMQKTFDPENPLSLKEVQEVYIGNGETPGLAKADYESLVKKLTSEKSVTPQDDFSSWVEVRNMQLTGASQAEVTSALASKIAEGKIGADKARQLFEKGVGPDSTNAAERVEAQGLRSFLAQNLLQGWDWMNGDQAQKAKVDEYVYKFHARVMDSKDKGVEAVRKIAQEIRDEAVREKHPELAGADEVPDVVLDQKGSVSRLFQGFRPKSSKPAHYTITRNKQGGADARPSQEQERNG